MCASTGGGHQAADAPAGAQPPADVGRRDVGRRRVDQEDRRPRRRVAAASAGSRCARASCGSRVGMRRRRHARARDDDEVREIEHLGIAVPGFDFRERVGAGDEEHLRAARVRARRAARASAPCTTVRRRAARHRETEHASRRLRRRAPPSRSGGTSTPTGPASDAAESRDGITRICDERRARCCAAQRRLDVADVDRIERAAEDARRESGRGPCIDAVPDRLGARVARRIRRRSRCAPAARRASSRQTASSSAGTPSPVAAETA